MLGNLQSNLIPINLSCIVFSDLLAYKNEYYQNKTLSRDDLYKLLHEFYSRICPDETNKIKELID